MGLSATTLALANFAPSVSIAGELRTDTAVGYFAQGIRAHQGDLFYVSYRSEHVIFSLSG